MQRNLLIEKQVFSDSVNKASSAWIAGFFQLEGSQFWATETPSTDWIITPEDHKIYLCSGDESITLSLCLITRPRLKLNTSSWYKLLSYWMCVPHWCDKAAGGIRVPHLVTNSWFSGDRVSDYSLSVALSVLSSSPNEDKYRTFSQLDMKLLVVQQDLLKMFCL